MAVGLRLLRLWSITHLLPELLLAIGLLCTGLLGFAVEMLAKVAPGVPERAQLALALVGLAGEYAGAVALIVFARKVFHPRARWAGALAWLTVVALVAALLGEWLSEQYLHYVDAQPIEGPYVPLGIAARGFAPAWMAIDAFRYHGLIRRRARIGLAEPLVVHRVALWGTASAASAIGHAVGVTHRAIWGTGLEAHTWSLNLVAGLAFVSAACIGLAFFPPPVYRRWVRRS
ncbi:MAG: hypothetical protein ACOC9O_00810 [Myxococcota bacterium]